MSLIHIYFFNYCLLQGRRNVNKYEYSLVGSGGPVFKWWQPLLPLLKKSSFVFGLFASYLCCHFIWFCLSSSLFLFPLNVCHPTWMCLPICLPSQLGNFSVVGEFVFFLYLSIGPTLKSSLIFRLSIFKGCTVVI